MSDNYQSNYATTLADEMDWDAVIEDKENFEPLPEGEYDFTVIKVERGTHNGSEKLSRCNKAILTIEIKDDVGRTATILHNFFIHPKCNGFLVAFFESIGHKEPGKPYKMNWSTVPGAKGRCKVYIDKWTNDKGEKRQSNKIKSFLEPKAAPAAGFTPGTF